MNSTLASGAVADYCDEHIEVRGGIVPQAVHCPIQYFDVLIRHRTF
jgi:hypothetical protein